MWMNTWKCERMNEWMDEEVLGMHDWMNTAVVWTSSWNGEVLRTTACLHWCYGWTDRNVTERLCFFDRASLYNLANKSTSCTILLNIFISLLYMFRASMCPSSGENYCIYATLVFFTMYWWLLDCWLDWIQPADQTPPIQSDKHQCRIDTVIFSWWWAHGCPKHVKKWNKYIKQNCVPSWTYLQDDLSKYLACLIFRVEY